MRERKKWEEEGNQKNNKGRKKIPYKNTYGVCIVFNFLCLVIISLIKNTMSNLKGMITSNVI